MRTPIIALAVAGAAGIAAATTETLSLEGLFADRAKGASAFVGNTALEAPDLTAWRAAPPPLPTPTPVLDVEVPTVERRPPGAFPTEPERVGEFFQSGGRHGIEALEGLAAVTIRSEGRRLRTRIELQPLDGQGRGIVLLHGPGMEESLALAPGRWQVRRTIWLPEAREVSVILEAEVQSLVGGLRYEGSTSAREEERWLRRLEQEQGRRRRALGTP